MKTYSLHRTRPRQRRLGNHGNERSKQNIKKIKETFFSFKKKGLSEKMRFDISLETMIHLYENDITDQIRL